ncbi:phospholipase A2 [Thraustotheca clavata]|uniref:Phospholipase A2 n=1 Tax=Thraustotheca clavata TaxID=74557 RepID=A0A1W0A9H5_9STRA|nr:phospholipase A2 [Thraustotheca clavata]
MKNGVLTSVFFLALAGVSEGMFDSNQVCDARGDICPSKKGVKKFLAPKRDYKIWANGCGTDSMGIQVMTGDGVDFTSCCNWHDACYGICGVSKNMCEKRFEKCMKDMCAGEVGVDAQKSCESMADIYVMGPKLMGCPAFTKAQREACTCVDKEKLPRKNLERLEYFLKKYGDGDASPEKLLEKYAGKEPLMFYRLLSKYPDALVIKEKPKSDQEKIFERMKGEFKKEKHEEEDVEHIEL